MLVMDEAWIQVYKCQTELTNENDNISRRFLFPRRSDLG